MFGFQKRIEKIPISNYFRNAKTTIEIPETTLDEAMKFTGAKTKREAVVTAVERFNRLKRLEKLNARVRGQFRDFMTQADLKAMRTADTPND
ncbi:MAG: type II toxin-antitoxin system VapB family antitoxin [Verrucomicrobiota bacterium]|nr:type II toxin-antitoxin system VapB family antitoxin [Verrucomicrobiota bacterium]